MSSSFGRLFVVTTFGESHGAGVGVVVDGMPPGIAVEDGAIQRELDRRRPGQSALTTQRQEGDRVEILSGIFEGVTLGTPIAMLVRNADARGGDYEEMRTKYRPSHADYTYQAKYGIRAWEGGGRASARETIGRVAAGAVAQKVLAGFGVDLVGWVAQVHEVVAHVDVSSVTRAAVEAHPTRCPIPEVAEEMARRIDAARRDGNSLGGVVEAVARGVPAGWGEPVFDKLDADIAHAMMGINAVKGVEIGAGFASIAQAGTVHSDEMTPQGFASNHAGGILGGISTGQDIVVSIAVKPTSSIRLDRRSIDKSGAPVTVNTHGRHDPCVGIRAAPIAEAMLLLVLIDHALRHRAQNADVICPTPKIAAAAPADVIARLKSAGAIDNPDPDEA